MIYSQKTADLGICRLFGVSLVDREKCQRVHSTPKVHLAKMGQRFLGITFGVETILPRAQTAHIVSMDEIPGYLDVCSRLPSLFGKWAI